MNSYNGFSPAQRNRAGVWINKQIAAGIIKAPTECIGCGQTNGIFDYHAEDYSEPFGKHLLEYPLCYVCHMMLHCRHHGIERWEDYKNLVSQGWRANAFMSRDWQRFKTTMLASENMTIYGSFSGPARRKTPLDAIGQVSENKVLTE